MIELSVGFGHAAPETANPGGFDRPFGRGAPDTANGPGAVHDPARAAAEPPYPVPMSQIATSPSPSAESSDPPTFRLFIAGEWCDSTSGATFESVNPADTRDVVGRFQQGT
ncbi:MAG: alpha-ketoglutaric semialdehyde dehydrogenase, partial [Thermoleophilaceae bacterium]|nr:alpha-ketoglutaric semialdehyde dehydrogenase [Thermoleophilaceae bacterium]